MTRERGGKKEEEKEKLANQKSLSKGNFFKNLMMLCIIISRCQVSQGGEAVVLQEVCESLSALAKSLIHDSVKSCYITDSNTSLCDSALSNVFVCPYPGRNEVGLESNRTTMKMRKTWLLVKRQEKEKENSSQKRLFPLLKVLRMKERKW